MSMWHDWEQGARARVRGYSHDVALVSIAEKSASEQTRDMEPRSLYELTRESDWVSCVRLLSEPARCPAVSVANELTACSMFPTHSATSARSASESTVAFRRIPNECEVFGVAGGGVGGACRTAAVDGVLGTGGGPASRAIKWYGAVCTCDSSAVWVGGSGTSMAWVGGNGATSDVGVDGSEVWISVFASDRCRRFWNQTWTCLTVAWT